KEEPVVIAMKDMPISFPGLFGDWELICVNDGSTVKTFLRRSPVKRNDMTMRNFLYAIIFL
ncbi:hypothetical protein EGQ24_01805, partial [bacterium]|nr:hypothetical protein [bacterium]